MLKERWLLYYCVWPNLCALASFSLFLSHGRPIVFQYLLPLQTSELALLACGCACRLDMEDCPFVVPHARSPLRMACL